jgi:hypothetical protein
MKLLYIAFLTLLIILSFFIFWKFTDFHLVASETPHPHVDEEIFKLFKTQRWVPVIVSLNVSPPLLLSAPEEEQEKRAREVKSIQDAVLSTLSKQEFTLHWRYERTGGFSGSITYSGLQKLLTNAYVTWIDLDKGSSLL